MRLAALFLLVMTSTAFAEDLSNFERVLIPAVTKQEIAGANGSRFVASRVFVSMDTAVRYFPHYATSVSEPAISQARPRELVDPFIVGPPSRLGRLLFLEKPLSNDVVVDAALFSRAGDDQRANETRLPIVRERDFKSGRTEILGVNSTYIYGPNACPNTATPQFRHALRVYDVDSRGDGAVIVRVFTDILGAGRAVTTPIREFTLPLTSREGSDPSYPAYGEATIDEVCVPFSCHTPCSNVPLRVEIEPVTPGIRYWAMVSATDNFTQQVSLAYQQ
ncbi:MAG TPA: hypothetical protein VF980_11770 [Thermoanaerobaculia bacterium]